MDLSLSDKGQALLHAPIVQRALPVLHRLTDAGYEAYFVGGAIRDALIGLPIHDIDIATSAFPAEVQALFKKHFDVGLEHGTVMAWADGETYEITTFRTESGYKDFRRPDKVTFVRNLREDLLRRDFTINALAMDQDGKIYDYFDGLTDLKQRMLRAVGVAEERFHEDALRMMRAVRFAGQLGFDVEDQTVRAIRDNAPLLEKISVERVRTELEKLYQGRYWAQGIRLFIDTTLSAHCPWVAGQQAAMAELYQNLAHDIALPPIELTWALTLWLTADDALTADQRIDRLTKQWKLSNQQKKTIQKYYRALQLRAVNEWNARAVYHLGLPIVSTVEQFIGTQQEASAPIGDAFSKGDVKKAQAIYDALPITDKKQLAINGKDVIEAFHPEPKALIGELLDQALDRVITNQVANERQALLTMLQQQLKE
ncbi:MAG: CCA tRNA nucleotidyltransferase [Aerococcus sp.]|nr:CCA tRNA nucleotidyltransferase [Aerococcus sp.]